MMVEGGKDDYVDLKCSLNLRHETPDDRIMHKSPKMVMLKSSKNILCKKKHCLEHLTLIQSCSKHSTRSIDISKPVIRIIGGAFREAITILTFPAGHYSCICSLSEV